MPQKLPRKSQHPKTRQKKQQFEAELYKRKMELRDLQKQRFDLFNDCINNIVESDEFLYARQTYAETYERLKQTIETLEHQYASYTKMLEPSGIVDRLKNYRSARKLSREMVDYFIKRVTVYSDKKIEIQWSFQNVFEEGGK